MKTISALALFMVLNTALLFGQNAGGEDCGTAVPIGVIGGPESCPGGAGFVNESTDEAEVATMNPSCDQFGSNYDLWYSFIAPSSGIIQLNIDLGTSSRIEAAVWEDCGSEIWCNSSNSNGSMIMGLNPGNTYFLQLWSDAFTRGTFDFCVFAKPGAPSNDNCEDPSALSVTNGLDPCSAVGGGNSYNNFGASASGTTPLPNCGNFGMGIDVWFSAVVPASGILTLEMINAVGPQDWAMAVYKGDCSALTLIECDDDSGSQLKPKIELTGRTPGEELLLRVWELGGDGFGSFELTATEPSSSTPPNNVCAGAIDITSVLSSSSGCIPVCGHNISSTPSGETPPSCGSFGAGRDVWYSVEVPAIGGFNIELDQFSTAGPQDWAMAAYTGMCGGGLVEIGCDDDSGPSLYPRLTVNNQVPGSTVYIRIWEFQGDEEGSFNICLTPLTPLALEMITLSGSSSSEGNLLSWESIMSTSIRNIDYRVSNDMLTWTTLHTSDAYSTSYLHLDPQAVQYYQLDMTDTEGEIHTSNVVALMDEGTRHFSVSPNPVRDQLRIDWTGADQDDVANILIIDMQGRVLMNTTIALDDASSSTISTSNMANGLYMVQVLVRGQKEGAFRILKQ